MLTILAPIDLHDTLAGYIAEEDRLNEVVFLQAPTRSDDASSFPILRIDHDGMQLPLSWDQSQPPYLLPDPLPIDRAHVLGLIFHLLENDPKVQQYLADQPIYADLAHQYRLKYGLPVDQLPTGEDYLQRHNRAVSLHYGRFSQPVQAVNLAQMYLAAAELAPSEELRAFTLRELATYYLDQGQAAEAEAVLQRVLGQSISQEAQQALKLLQVKVGMQQLVVPYEEGQLDALKHLLWEVLSQYEAQGQDLQVGLLLLDATHLASVSQSYAEALGYIRRAIDLFDAAGMEALAANGHVQKGILLATWAQTGQPQFYKTAVDSYQRALSFFTKEAYPEAFADLHHKLGVLYAEMPTEFKRRGIWAGVASASFQEALAYFTKETHPYEYGSVCNNFANAFMKFPPALRSDNHVKALSYYEEALSVRTRQYPYERAITLLNYLEASWNVGNDPSSFNHARYDDMIAKAEEISQLVQDADMLAAAAQHLENLTKLKSLIQTELADA